eukprot:345257-Chlamydomonas_euryale.AAC.1
MCVQRGGCAAQRWADGERVRGTGRRGDKYEEGLTGGSACVAGEACGQRGGGLACLRRGNVCAIR